MTSQVPTFAAVCVAIAIDLGCSNVAISLLSVALQQARFRAPPPRPSTTLYPPLAAPHRPYDNPRAPPKRRPSHTQHPQFDSTPAGHPRSVVCATRPQVLRAAAPAATMLIEVVIKRKPQKPLMVLAVICVSAGPVLTQLGSSIDGSVVGVAMQLAAVFGSASKSVFGHAILTQHKKKLGLLSFLSIPALNFSFAMVRGTVGCVRLMNLHHP